MATETKWYLLFVNIRGKILSKNLQSNKTYHQITDNVSLFVFTAMLLTSKLYHTVERSWECEISRHTNNKNKYLPTFCYNLKSTKIIRIFRHKRINNTKKNACNQQLYEIMHYYSNPTSYTSPENSIHDLILIDNFCTESISLHPLLIEMYYYFIQNYFISSVYSIVREND
jgi:hypothetical protein